MVTLLNIHSQTQANPCCLKYQCGRNEINIAWDPFSLDSDWSIIRKRMESLTSLTLYSKQLEILSTNCSPFNNIFPRQLMHSGTKEQPSSDFQFAQFSSNLSAHTMTDYCFLLSNFWTAQLIVFNLFFFSKSTSENTLQRLLKGFLLS